MLQKQRIWIFQQNKSGEEKSSALLFVSELDVRWISIDVPLPEFIENPEIYLPSQINAELVINHLTHPDLCDELGKICEKWGIPAVSPGKKNIYTLNFTPPTCCGLERSEILGTYGYFFGAPEFDVVISSEGSVDHINVLRGAPCGATKRVVDRLKGIDATRVAERIGLELQYECKADPAGWDPIYGESPVHFAGKSHQVALEKALQKKGVFSKYNEIFKEDLNKGKSK